MIAVPTCSGVSAGPRRARKVGISTPCLGGVGGDSGRAQFCFGGELRQHGGEPDAERIPAGLRGGIGRNEPDGGLGPGVAAGQWRAVDRGSAGEGDDRAAWLQGKQQRLASPVEHVLHVDVPVAAEGLPGLPVDRVRQGSRPGVEDQRAGAVLVEEVACDHGIGGVGGDGGEGAAELCAQFLEPGAVAGNPDDVRALLGQGDGDAAAETPASPVTSAVVPDSSCVGMLDSLAADAEAVRLDLGGCGLGFGGCAGNRCG
jgi:hypothetical protein